MLVKPCSLATRSASSGPPRIWTAQVLVQTSAASALFSSAVRRTRTAHKYSSPTLASMKRRTLYTAVSPFVCHRFPGRAEALYLTAEWKWNSGLEIIGQSHININIPLLTGLPQFQQAPFIRQNRIISRKTPTDLNMSDSNVTEGKKTTPLVQMAKQKSFQHSIIFFQLEKNVMTVVYMQRNQTATHNDIQENQYTAAFIHLSLNPFLGLCGELEPMLAVNRQGWGTL